MIEILAPTTLSPNRRYRTMQIRLGSMRLSIAFLIVFIENLMLLTLFVN